MRKNDFSGYPNQISLEAELLSSDEYPGSAYMEFSFDFMAVFGSRGRIPVYLKVGEFTYRSTIAVYAGVHMMVFNKQMRNDTGYKAGDTIAITLVRDTDLRKAEIADDVRTKLIEAGVWDAFDRYSYSHQKETMDWITDAKKQETRQNRIVKLIQILVL